jgi:hypothetical protein
MKKYLAFLLDTFLISTKDHKTPINADITGK